jgi:transcriptional regulator with XRE-family HTH domain
MGVGKELKRIREASGFTSLNMSKCLGIDNPERYRNWEKRDGTPKYEDRIKIENFFGQKLENLSLVQAIPYEKMKPFLEYHEPGELVIKNQVPIVRMDLLGGTYLEKFITKPDRIIWAAGKVVEIEYLYYERTEIYKNNEPLNNEQKTRFIEIENQIENIVGTLQIPMSWKVLNIENFNLQYLLLLAREIYSQGVEDRHDESFKKNIEDIEMYVKEIYNLKKELKQLKNQH